MTEETAAIESAEPSHDRSALATAVAASLVLESCGSGGTSPSGGTPTPASPPLTASQASRFLSQAAIGYSKADINSVRSGTLDDWITGQFGTGRRQKFWDFLTSNGYDGAANVNDDNGFEQMIWSQLISGVDPLRQRVGLALLNIWVVGIDSLPSPWNQFVMASYLDVLWDNAFANYRDIMEGVSTSIAMGNFLTFLNNQKSNAARGSIPDENYARESMQLFTIGLYQLNSDGTRVLSAGNPVPTYTQEDVSQGARVWTGYVLPAGDNATPARFRQPMAINASQHETGATSFLGISIPAGSDAASARKIALDGLFNHSNLPPFVCKQLIQNFVTSNPSPAYVGRVAKIFSNNGVGVRGDMRAVVRAILTDSEARDDANVSSATFGKLREPVVRFAQWARAFGVTSPNNLWPFGNLSSSSNRLGESPGHAPSVFNWFRPGYTPPGTAVASAGLVAPEFQITNEPSLIAYINYMQAVIPNGAGEAKPDYTSLTAIAADSQALLNELNLVLAADQIGSNTIAQMKSALDTIATGTNVGLLNRVYTGILLVMAAPEYLVQR